MADIFREIDEEVRRERALDVWRKHGNKIVGLAVLIVLAVAGWRGWQYVETQKAQEAGAKFEQALLDSKAGKTAEAEQVFAELAKSSTSGYQKLARLREAGEISKADPTKAVAAYDAIAADVGIDPAMRDVARLRAAILLVDAASADELSKRLAPVFEAGTFAPNAHELVGLAALKAGDYEAAGKEFDKIVTDRNAPPSLRQRAELLLALVKAGPLKPAS